MKHCSSVAAVVMVIVGLGTSSFSRGDEFVPAYLQAARDSEDAAARFVLFDDRGDPETLAQSAYQLHLLAEIARSAELSSTVSDPINFHILRRLYLRHLLACTVVMEGVDDRLAAGIAQPDLEECGDQAEESYLKSPYWRLMGLDPDPTAPGDLPDDSEDPDDDPMDGGGTGDDADGSGDGGDSDGPDGNQGGSGSGAGGSNGPGFGGYPPGGGGGVDPLPNWPVYGYPFWWWWQPGANLNNPIIGQPQPRRPARPAPRRRNLPVPAPAPVDPGVDPTPDDGSTEPDPSPEEPPASGGSGSEPLLNVNGPHSVAAQTATIRMAFTERAGLSWSNLEPYAETFAARYEAIHQRQIAFSGSEQGRKWGKAYAHLYYHGRDEEAFALQNAGNYWFHFAGRMQTIATADTPRRMADVLAFVHAEKVVQVAEERLFAMLALVPDGFEGNQGGPFAPDPLPDLLGIFSPLPEPPAPTEDDWSEISDAYNRVVVDFYGGSLSDLHAWGSWLQYYSVVDWLIPDLENISFLQWLFAYSKMMDSGSAMSDSLFRIRDENAKATWLLASPDPADVALAKLALDRVAAETDQYVVPALKDVCGCYVASLAMIGEAGLVGGGGSGGLGDTPPSVRGSPDPPGGATGGGAGHPPGSGGYDPSPGSSSGGSTQTPGYGSGYDPPSSGGSGSGGSTQPPGYGSGYDPPSSGGSGSGSGGSTQPPGYGSSNPPSSGGSGSGSTQPPGYGSGYDPPSSGGSGSGSGGSTQPPGYGSSNPPSSGGSGSGSTQPPGYSSSNPPSSGGSGSGSTQPPGYGSSNPPSSGGSSGGGTGSGSGTQPPGYGGADPPSNGGGSSGGGSGSGGGDPPGGGGSDPPGGDGNGSSPDAGSGGDGSTQPPGYGSGYDPPTNGGGSGSGGGTPSGGAAPAAPGVTLPQNPGQIQHIFRNAPGHLPNTPANRALLESLANDTGAVLGPDRFGNIWAARLNPDGTQTWVQYRNGVIINGGVNPTPRTYNPQTGLSGP